MNRYLVTPALAAAAVLALAYRGPMIAAQSARAHHFPPPTFLPDGELNPAAPPAA
jgi:hypothetical protein